MPPLAHRTSRVTISGTYAGGAEEWSTGFWFGAANEDAALPTQELADGIAAAWKTFFISPSSYISSRWTTTTVKIASVGTDGKSDANDTVYSNNQLPATGVAATHYPPQITLAATMVGPANRGLASNGRMYIPGVSAAVDGTGHIAGIDSQNIATNFGNFIKAVNALPENNVVVLASHGSLDEEGQPKIGGKAPITKAVTVVKVGNVYDTQRRRRNGLNEQYFAAGIV